MKVRCVKLLRGGKAGSEEVAHLSSLHVGGEYVVLSIAGRPIDGIEYLLLQDGSTTETVAATSEMFEIVSGKISPSWCAHDPYGTGKVISVEPASWIGVEFPSEGGTATSETRDAFRREVARLYEEEDESLPEPRAS